MSEKRKVEFITLDSSETSKKTKPVNKTDFKNYLLFSDNTGDNEIVNNHVKNFIDAFLATLETFQRNNFDIFLNRLEMLIKTLEDIKIKKPSFLNQKHFQNLFISFTKDIQSCTKLEQVLDFNMELNLELRRMTMSSKKINGGNKLINRVKTLTKAIVKVQDNISKLEHMELSLDDLNQSKSVFTQLPRLKRSQLKLWYEREKLLERSDFTGRNSTRGFSFNGTPNQQINKIVEKFFCRYLNLMKKDEDSIIYHQSNKQKFNSKFAFFTVIELKNHLKEEIEKQKISFDVNEELLTKIYDILLKENKDRRIKDQMDSFRSLEILADLKPKNMVDETDPLFLKEISKNQETGEKKLIDLENEFRNKDFEKNGKDLEQGKPLGFDDQDESDIDDEEDEESDEESDEKSDEESL